MERLVEFPLRSGGTILVEVDEPQQAGVVRAGRPGQIVEKVSRSFEDALQDIKPAAVSIIGELRGLAEPPDEVEVEFGLKLTMQAGAIVASGAAEGNFRVKLSWSRT